jgi:hypothetical protein
MSLNDWKQRAHERVACAIPAAMGANASIPRGTVHDIGAGGLMVEVLEPPLPGAEAVLRLWPLGPSEDSVLAQVQVVWSMPADGDGFGGFGGAWVRLESGAIEPLRGLFQIVGGPILGTLTSRATPTGARRYQLQAPPRATPPPLPQARTSPPPPRAERCVTALSATYYGATLSGLATVVRASEGAVVLDTRDRIPQDADRLTVRVTLPLGKSSHTVDLEGQVIRRRPAEEAGAGGRFWMRILEASNPSSRLIYRSYVSAQ